MANTSFTMTQGETGKRLWFKLETTDDEGLPVALNLTGWTVTLTVTRNAVNYIENAACTPDADQTTNTGEGEFVFSAPQANLSPNRYWLRLKAVNGSNVLYFPTQYNQTYATLRVLAQ